MTQSKQILVVDDEPGLTSLYEAWLIPEYSVRQATGGEEALTAIEKGVDAILLDRQMPGLSGDEVLLELRDRGHTCSVGLVTAAKPDVETLTLPFDAYLLKPIDRERILECVDRLLSIGQYDDSSRKCFRLASKVETLSRAQTLSDSAKKEILTKLEREFATAAPHVDPSARELLSNNERFAPLVSSISEQNPFK